MGSNPSIGSKDTLKRVSFYFCFSHSSFGISKNFNCLYVFKLQLLLLNVLVMKRFAFYLLPILLCFAVGLSASYFQSDSISEWYPLLNKPVLTPPNGAFPIAWSIIYICMGLSLGHLIERGADKTLSVLWGIQLVVNFLWSLLFFAFRNPFLGLVDILLLDILVWIYISRAYRKEKAAALLFVPYFLWLLLATYLNGYVYLYN